MCGRFQGCPYLNTGSVLELKLSTTVPGVGKDGLVGANEESFDVTMTQHSHSHLPLRYVPPPAVWLAALARRPRPLLPSTGQHAAVALFAHSSSNSSRWHHCAPSGAS